mmetsp:Transcript_39015/g.49815  ORF Transcript_39015/g.49815 Transcript_39015/m.49815 type:complete len:302 (-) Transcript_39015:146-1051(-)
MYVFSHTESISKEYDVMTESLNQGSYGVVRQCVMKDTNEVFAVKTILKKEVHKCQQIRNEVLILKLLSHPNVMELTAIYENETSVHIVTPYYPGGDLFEEFIRRKRFKKGGPPFLEQEASSFTKQMLSAISYCHSQGVVHRDVKMENFVLRTQISGTELVLIDFGLSKKKDSARKYLTTCVGTPHYMAPEVIARRYTHTCDIWSIGIILYVMLCGHFPFDARDELELALQIRYTEISFPKRQWTGLSSESKDLIQVLLCKSKIKRPSAKQALCYPWFSLSEMRRNSISKLASKFSCKSINL